jgi:hypothetical protein
MIPEGIPSNQFPELKNKLIYNVLCYPKLCTSELKII